ncbi:DUF1820 family protein [Reinekea sp.]|jgi:hypothetical protein|uniref:DUF1820 family protein n=1 Tax=Reinekea sp. TaxID=1970455 RepID=UPI002A806CAD|nr:DUF1820 family protein [Reinekea sp.]
MTSSQAKTVFRVIFVNQDKLYELYCRHVYQSEMYGFIEIEELIFGARSQVLVDPSEEKLQQEFSGVTRSFVPMHAIVRIDEVEQEGTPKISDAKGTNVSTFPSAVPPRRGS